MSRSRRASAVPGSAVVIGRWRGNGGDIIVAQRPGGATFTLSVTLPAPGRRKRRTGRGRRSPLDQARGLRSQRRDNPFGRVVLNAILRTRPPAEFIGREIAAERIAEGAFDAVLMDMVLPGINGIGRPAIRNCRAVRPHRHHRVPGRGDDEAASRRRRQRLSGQACGPWAQRLRV
jgi:hypothetical protein